MKSGKGAGGSPPARLLARSVRGLEWIAADEVAGSLPAEDLVLSAREIRFSLSQVDERVLGLRTADDLFLVVGRARDLGHTKDVPPRLAEKIGSMDWDEGLRVIGEVRGLPRRPAFDVVASFGGKRNFNRYALEDAIGGALAPRLGEFRSRTPGKDGRPRQIEPGELTVRIFLDGETVTAALRVAARPLHRREYKQDTGPGTLHPPLAAAIARLSGAGAGDLAFDPFCGDGTVAIELAVFGASVLAGDLDPSRVRNAVANATRAGAGVGFFRADAGSPPVAAGTVDALVTNPPWELAVAAAGSLAGSLRPFWDRVPALLGPAGRLCVVTDDELDAPGLLAKAGYAITLAVRVRLAGRLSHVVLCAPPGRPAPELPGALAEWRARAHEAGVVDDTGF